MSQRLSVNINDATAVALEDSARCRETTVTEVVRRAVSLYKFLADQDAAGNRIQLEAEGQATVLKLL